MPKLKVIIEIEIKADPTDDEAIREAIYERLTEDMESEDLEFTVDSEENEEDEEN